MLDVSDNKISKVSLFFTGYTYLFFPSIFVVISPAYLFICYCGVGVLSVCVCM